MPVGPTGLEEVFSQAAMYIHAALHPLSILIHSFLGVRVTADVDLAAWALLTWIMGSRESEAVKKLGFVGAMALLAVAVLEAVLLEGWV